MRPAVQLLAEADNWTLLQDVQLLLQNQPASFKGWEDLNEKLRKSGATAELASAITSQLQLREEAEKKFGDSAAHMLFTRAGLEQATRLSVTLLHARRFLTAGLSTVADLGCGLGTEALALATTGLKVVAVDKDPEATTCAAVNLRPFPEVDVLKGDLFDVTPQWLHDRGVDGIFLDPARRTERGRTFDPEQWAPPWSWVKEALSWGFPTGVKLAPGVGHSLLPPNFHATWLRAGGELVEASLWSPTLSPAGPGRSAAVFNGSYHQLTDPLLESADGPIRPAPAGPLSLYVHEPGPEVIRAGLIARLAELTKTHLLYPGIAYLTGAELSPSPFYTSFQVLDSVPLRGKKISATLRNLEARSVEVKKRGVQIDTSELQRSLSKTLDTGGSGGTLTVFATRTDAGHRAIITRRCPFPPHH